MSAGYLRKCAGKRQHPTQDEAEEHRRHLVRLGLWTMSKTNTYRCTQCGSYHTGRVGTKFRGKGKATRKGRGR